MRWWILFFVIEKERMFVYNESKSISAGGLLYVCET